MGTYMDGFIEVDHGVDAPPFSIAGNIRSLTEGSFVFGKDYAVFDALAAGREASMSPDDKDPINTPKYAPRGMPVPQSSDVAQHFFRLVAHSEQPPNPYFWPQHRCIPPNVAREWIDGKGCLHSTVIQSVNCFDFDPDAYTSLTDLVPTVGQFGHIKWHVVAEPCFYNATWLRLREFEESLRAHGLDFDEVPVEYSILRHSMEALVDKWTSERVRLVIWFS